MKRFGQVIGINVATSVGADNISFSIPVNELKPIFESFLEEGRIVRPYLGVYFTMVTPEISKLRELPEGAFVSRVISGSPAEEVGIERGDIITNFGDYPLDADNTLGKLVSKSKVGDRVKLTVDRDGRGIFMNVVLVETPEIRE